MNQALSHNYSFSPLYHAGWRYCGEIRKKAMEQEFSWAGLVVSLSIAFFVVIMTASAFSLMLQNLEKGQSGSMPGVDVYRLESYQGGPAEGFIEEGQLNIKIQKDQLALLV
jgi:hypothetical protein